MISREQIAERTAALPGLEARLSDPKQQADGRKYAELVREHRTLSKLKQKADRYFNLLQQARDSRDIAASSDSDPDLRDLAHAEIEKLDNDIAEAEKDLTRSLVPPDPDSARNAIMEIRAGTGGEEAALFAGDLFRMYGRFAESKGWKTATIDASFSDMGGCKYAVFSVEGEGAFGLLRFESGVHRVQRVPVTEASGRIHTSAATVAVFPEAEPEDDIQLDPAEIRVDIFRSSGPGGQSVNTTDSAVRVTHLPTGLVVQCQDEKSQHKNKEKAFGVLKSRILDMRRQEEEKRRGSSRKSQIGSGDRSERIRTYNFPQNRVTDHRINVTLYSLDRFVEGELDGIVDALHDHDIQLKLAAKP